MHFRLLFSFLLFSMSIFSQSQRGNKLGWYINHNNDTIHGIINLLSDFEKTSYLFVITEGNNAAAREVGVYSINEVKWGDDLYVKKLVPRGNGRIFALVKVLSNGPVKLYVQHCYDYRTLGYIFDQDTNRVQQRKRAMPVYYMSKNDGPLETVSMVKFNELTSKFLSDVPALADRIKKGEFRLNQIVQVVQMYNESKKP